MMISQINNPKTKGPKIANFLPREPVECELSVRFHKIVDPRV
jgi:hypothetical protein